MNPRRRHTLVSRLAAAMLFAAPAAITACGGGRQVYDPYYADNHRWSRTEDGFYRRWEGETGRPHAAFEQRPAQDQHAYFDWRHRQ